MYFLQMSCVTDHIDIFLLSQITLKKNNAGKYVRDWINTFNFKIKVLRVRSYQTEDYKISLCCFGAKHAVLRNLKQTTICLGIRIICSNGGTCLSANCCFSELEL